MISYVTGSTDKNKRLVYHVIEHCYNELIPEYDTDIYIELTIPDDNLNGWCEYDGENFEIEIKESLSREELIKTVAHEMVHVKQYLTGELVEERCKRIWKGVDHTDDTHFNYPWEIEAYKLEEILYKSFEEMI
jgi:hypothetical protein